MFLHHDFHQSTCWEANPDQGREGEFQSAVVWCIYIETYVDIERDSEFESTNHVQLLT